MKSNLLKLIISATLGLFLIVFGKSVVLAQTPTATLTLPATLSTTVGQQIDVPVTLNTGGAAVRGVDIILNFDKTKLSVVSVTPTVNATTLGITSPISSSGTFDSVKVVSNANTNGQIEFGFQTFNWTTNLVTNLYTGNAQIATVRFQALQSGATTVSFGFTAGSTTDTNIVSGSNPPTDLLTQNTQLTNLNLTIAALSSPTPTPTSIPTTTPTPTPALSIVPGDVNGDGKVDAADIKLELQNWGNAATGALDQYIDSKSNSLDFTQIANWIPSPSATPTPTPCTLATGTWNPASTTQGSPVNLNVTATGSCTNQQVSLTIFKNGLCGGQLTTTITPNPITLTTNSGTASWTSEFTSDACGLLGQPNQYYFNATINGVTTTLGNNPLLSVSPLVSPTPTPTPSGPTPTPNPNASLEWTQFGHDPQRTNYTAQTVATPWKYLWQWNGADANGQPQASHISVPNMVQPITGGSRVYMVAGNSVYALNPTTGAVYWSRGNIGALSSTPVYDAENLYVASGDNHLYKLDASTGNIVSTFAAASALNLAPLLANGTLYVGSSGGILYAVNPGTMTQVWQYNAGSAAATSAVYSSSRNVVVFVAHDLYVHAVNVSGGTMKWKVKPTVRNYQCVNYSGDPCNVSADATGAQAETGWPVIAEQHGIVFVKYRVDWNSLWAMSPAPTTNSAIRSALVSQPAQQSLYALSLDTGLTAFIPAIGPAGSSDAGNMEMGPLPIISVQNGQEVAYVPWRNGQLDPHTNGTDSRGDFHVGEMELDSNTVSGYQAGDLRFVVYQFFPTDETMQMTMAGNTLFYNHWLVVAAQTISNRAVSLGDTPTNGIQTAIAPFTTWREGPATYAPCTFNTLTRYCSPNLLSYGDTREYSAGFYEYFNSQGGFSSTPYTIVSNGLILQKSIDGGLIALQNGNPLGQATQSQPLAQANQVNSAVLGTSISNATVNYLDAGKYLNQTVTVDGVVGDAVNRLPKAVYLPFDKFHDGKFQIRIFNKDINKFTYNPMTLKGKHIRVTGKITLYPPIPGPTCPEIIITDPSQIQIVQ